LTGDLWLVTCGLSLKRNEHRARYYCATDSCCFFLNTFVDN
jgi:hypothetical protein